MSKRNGRPITCRVCKVKFYKSESEKPEWIKLKLPCPECETTYCCLPKQERDLMKLQDLYYAKNRDTQYIGQMYEILFPYARSMAFKVYGGIMNEEYHEEFAHEASILLLTGYYKFDDFKIEKSFGGYLLKRFLQIKIDEMKNEVSINEINDENKEYFQLESSIDLLQEENIVQEKIAFLNKIMSAVRTSHYKINKKDDLFRLIAVSQKIMNEAEPTIFKVYPNRPKDAYLKTMSQIRNLLLNSGKENE
jgi:hypothetical protein